MGFDDFAVVESPFHARVRRRPLREGDLIRRHAHLACGRLLNGLDGLECRLVAGVAVDSRRAAAADTGVLDACLRVQLLSLDLAQWDLEFFRDNFAQY